MKKLLITSMLIASTIFLFTACETNQPNMHNNDWHWGMGMGMGWGTWIVLFLVIAVILYFLRTRRRK